MALYEKHKLSHIPEHKIWSGMKERCYNPNNDHYQRYGGRGIVVCDHWKYSFSNFYKDMGPRPTPEHSIDRKNNDGNYELTNCKWSTVEEQANNKSSNIKILLPTGELCTPKEASNLLGVSINVVRDRHRNGIRIDKELKTFRTHLTYKGELVPLSELQDIAGIPSRIILNRVDSGMEIERAITMPERFTKLYPYKDTTITLSEIAEIENLNETLLARYINSGRTMSDIIKHLKINNQNRQVFEDNIRNETSDYHAWSKMIEKCYDPKSLDYKYNGAIGRTVVDSWKDSFTNFLKDLGPRPSNNHALFLVNKDKPYGPSNTKWKFLDKTFIEVQTLTSVTLPDGRVMSPDIAARELGYSVKLLWERLRNNIPLNRPVRKVKLL